MSPLASPSNPLRAGIISLLAIVTTAAHAQDAASAVPAASPAAAAAPAADATKPASFRAPTAALNAPAPSAVGSAPAGELSPIPSGTSHQDLLDRRDSLEGDIRYGKAKLDAGRKRVEILQAVGKTEDAERLNGEIKDWEARIKNAREQLAQVEEELGKSPSGGDLAPSQQSGEEVILPANNLELFVNEDTSFNGRYQVRRGGYIILPQVGRVLVAGKTIAQAEMAVRKALQATQLRRATVMIERFDGVSDEAGPMIYLSGEFKNPRPYRIPAGTAPTLVSVLLSAGGWTDRADLTKVKVMRMAANRSVAETVNVKKILAGEIGGDLGSDLTLSEGDVVVVPSGSVNLIYVTGRVKKSGSYRVGEGEKLTAYGSILQSGGLDHFADKKKVHVLRSMPDGTKARLPMNIADIEKGKRPDVVLQPNDIVVVPEKWFAW